MKEKCICIYPPNLNGLVYAKLLVYLGKRKGKVAPGLETYGGVEIQLHHS
jgi:hypothetical protein